MSDPQISSEKVAASTDLPLDISSSSDPNLKDISTERHEHITETKWKVSRTGDGDAALALFQSPTELHEPIDPIEEAKLVRKIDFMILPCMEKDQGSSSVMLTIELQIYAFAMHSSISTRQ